MLDRAVFVPGDDGRPEGMIGLLIDLSGLHAALDAQAESERRLRTTIGNVPGMVYRSQAMAPWSDELIAGGDVSVTGYSVEELTHPDFRWADIMEPEDVPLLTEATAGALESGRGAAEYRIRAKDGSERWLLDRFTLLKDEQGEPVAQEGILLDITEQHLIQDELEASRRELELHARIATIFLTAAPDAMFTEILGRGARGGGRALGLLRLHRPGQELSSRHRSTATCRPPPGSRRGRSGSRGRPGATTPGPAPSAPASTQLLATPGPACPRATCPSAARWRRRSCSARRRSAC